MPATPAAPNAVPNRGSTGEFVAELQKELNAQYNNRGYKMGKPVGNPRPIGELLKGLPPKGVGAEQKKAKK